MTVHVSVPLAEHEKAELDEIAQHEERSPEDLVAALVRRRLQYEREYREAVEEGMAQARRGEARRP
jgi:predicted transcriptional regulator